MVFFVVIQDIIIPICYDAYLIWRLFGIGMVGKENLNPYHTKQKFCALRDIIFFVSLFSYVSYALVEDNSFKYKITRIVVILMEPVYFFSGCWTRYIKQKIHKCGMRESGEIGAMLHLCLWIRTLDYCGFLNVFVCDTLYAWSISNAVIYLIFSMFSQVGDVI